MISQKKIEANRRNALKSTGPRTEEGKAVSRMNNLTHGLTSKFVPILPGENEAEFNELRTALVNDLKPRGALQREIVEDITQIRWKLRRSSRVECELMENHQNAVRRNHERDRINQRGRDHPEPLKDHPVEILARVGITESEYGRIELYRQRLQRQMHTLLRELRQLRKETGQGEESEEIETPQTPAASENAPGKAEPTDSHNPLPDKWKENDTAAQNSMIPGNETENPCAQSSPDRLESIKAPISKPSSNSPPKTAST